MKFLFFAMTYFSMFGPLGACSGILAKVSIWRAESMFGSQVSQWFHLENTWNRHEVEVQNIRYLTKAMAA